jgi:hypothetical protein
VEKVLADAFLDFYKKILKPEFDEIKAKQVEQDERLSHVLGHLDSIYSRVLKLEEEEDELKSRLDSIERRIKL